jgi:hypothetical protein
MLKRTIFLTILAHAAPASAVEVIRYAGRSTGTDAAGLDCEFTIIFKERSSSDREDNRIESVSLVGVGRDWNHANGAAVRQLATTVHADPEQDFNQLGYTFRDGTFEALSSRSTEMVYRPDGLTYPTDENIKVMLKGRFSTERGLEDLPTQIEQAWATHEVFSEAKGLMARSTVECAHLFIDPYPVRP